MAIETELDIKRIQALTDATFAVAMTILILEVKIPHGLSSVELSKYFREHTFIELFIYSIGFVTLGIFWIGSHFHHHHLVKTDWVSSWLNILFLMFICIIPFSISFLKNYRHEKLSVVFYSINLLVASIFNYLMLWYAWTNKYLKPYYTYSNYKDSRRRILIPIYCYLSIIFISFFSTDVAILFFLFPVMIHLIPEKANKIND